MSGKSPHNNIGLLWHQQLHATISLSEACTLGYICYIPACWLVLNNHLLSPLPDPTLQDSTTSVTLNYSHQQHYTLSTAHPRWPTTSHRRALHLQWLPRRMSRLAPQRLMFQLDYPYPSRELSATGSSCYRLRLL